MKGEKEMENVYVCVFEREREGGRRGEGEGREEGGSEERGPPFRLHRASLPAHTCSVLLLSNAGQLSHRF